MAPELDVGMSMGRGMMPMSMVNMDSGAYFCGIPSSDGLPIDDLLDFSHQDVIFDSPQPGYVAETHQPHHLPSHDYSSAFNASDFSDDLYVPSEDAAELEWLSNFVDDSFADAVPFPLSISGGQNSDLSAIPARARSKRSKALQNPTSTWSSPFSTSPTSSSSSLSEFPHGATAVVLGPEVIASGSAREGGARRCTHCASEKTPQWRTGPLGPKTLCNACGVRYKSGRLVPEYRPAASPTFVLTQHSNSHRKVMELRRQKELVFRNHGGAATATSPSSRPELLFHDHKVS